MLAIPSLLAAMTIAGAFWVGVLAARRLRDWGDGSRALGAGQEKLALGPTGDAGAVARVRERVASSLQREAHRGVRHAVERDADGLDLATLRVGDVVVVDAGEPGEGDYLVEGLLRLREGAASTVVAILADGEEERWLIGNPTRPTWSIVQPVFGHGLRGEPPRQLNLGEKKRRAYRLERRGQASVAASGQTGRPSGNRVATFTFAAEGRAVAWLERWGDEVFAGTGETLAAHAVSFLPGSQD